MPCRADTGSPTSRTVPSVDEVRCSSGLILVRFSSLCTALLYVIIDTHISPTRFVWFCITCVRMYDFSTEVSPNLNTCRPRTRGIPTSHSLALNTTLVGIVRLSIRLVHMQRSYCSTELYTHTTSPMRSETVTLFVSIWDSFSMT